jgi:hypothetical protein
VRPPRAEAALAPCGGGGAGAGASGRPLRGAARGARRRPGAGACGVRARPLRRVSCVWRTDRSGGSRGGPQGGSAPSRSSGVGPGGPGLRRRRSAALCRKPGRSAQLAAAGGVGESAADQRCTPRAVRRSAGAAARSPLPVLPASALALESARRHRRHGTRRQGDCAPAQVGLGQGCAAPGDAAREAVRARRRGSGPSRLPRAGQGWPCRAAPVRGPCACAASPWLRTARRALPPAATAPDMRRVCACACMCGCV